MWLAASFGPKVFCKASETQSLPDRPLTLKDLDWRPLLLPPLAGFDPFQPSGADLEKLRALQREPRLECEFDCTMLPGGSFVEHGRPCFGRLGLLVKKQRGLVIGMNVASGALTPGKPPDALWSRR